MKEIRILKNKFVLIRVLVQIIDHIAAAGNLNQFNTFCHDFLLCFLPLVARSIQIMDEQMSKSINNSSSIIWGPVYYSDGFERTTIICYWTKLGP